MGGGGKNRRAREENQRRVKKWKGWGERRENFGGLSYSIPSWAGGGGGGQDTIRYRPMW